MGPQQLLVIKDRMHIHLDGPRTLHPNPHACPSATLRRIANTLSDGLFFLCPPISALCVPSPKLDMS
jgi:hypothetical protein